VDGGQKHGAWDAKPTRGSRNGSPVVSGRRAYDAVRQLLGTDRLHRVQRARDLEGLQTEPMRFVLDQDVAQRQLRGQTGQGKERSRRETRPSVVERGHGAVFGFGEQSAVPGVAPNRRISMGVKHVRKLSAISYQLSAPRTTSSSSSDIPNCHFDVGSWE
jgi:hypothetical protein